MYSFASGTRIRLFITGLSVSMSALALGCAAPVTDDSSGVGPSPGLSGLVETLPTERADIIYFHRPYTCHCSYYIESRIRETMRTYFAAELESGSITFQSVDITKPENAEIVEKCGAYSSQLFIITVTEKGEDIADVTLETLPMLDDQESVAATIRARIGSALE